MTEMVEKYDLDEEVREAVAVALLANESVYHEVLPAERGEDEGACEDGKTSHRAVTVRGGGEGEPALLGEFYFPAD